MKFAYRLFAAYCLLLMLAGWLFYNEFSTEMVPGMRQSLEDALVDTSNLLAALVTKDVQNQSLGNSDFALGVESYQKNQLQAEIWSLKRQMPDLFVYITDEQGIVIFDSRGIALGADYSRWNDVYRTLRGQYGARTTRYNESDPTSSVMYVAAPIKDGNQIIGVLTVGKPSKSVQPYVDQLLDKLLIKGLWLVLLSIGLAMLLSWGLSRSIGKLTEYAQKVKQGEKTVSPQLGEPELAELAVAMASMREALEGKDYVEQYLYTLTHELKSPLAAIQGASELIKDQQMPEEDRQKFIANIQRESERMSQLVQRLLGLAALEKRQELQNIESINMTKLLQELCQSRSIQLDQKRLRINLVDNQKRYCQGEAFLIRQAMGNLLDNAIDFSPEGGVIKLEQSDGDGFYRVSILDQGEGIPDYAQGRVFERFYSLPRPDGGSKSSGLGLAFVKEAIELHQGEIRIANGETGGACVEIHLPSA